MRRRVAIFLTLCLTASGVLPAQKAADANRRYFRLICLVHLTGSGKAGDPIVPEYVVEGTAVATAAQQAASTALANLPQMSASVSGVATAGASQSGAPTPPSPTTAPPADPKAMASRPGFLGWGMQLSDDGTMAIIHIVAADHHAFDSILADKRPEIRVFEIGKDSKETIEAAMRQYRKDFDLSSFQVIVQ